MALKTSTSLENIERPLPADLSNGAWGSDVVAEILRRCDIPYVALVPGSSYRGLQDSLVNYLGNDRPQLLVCLHEEHAVAIAHGFARVTETAMAAAVHSNVGLMHALMAVYNAYCDRAPLLLLGATGPVDANRRRPWIDWIHTSRDQGALLRGYVKWDDQPASPEAAMEATLRGIRMTNANPKAPVYICYDVSDQECTIGPDLTLLDPSRYAAPADPQPQPSEIARALELLKASRRCVILAGRVSRSKEDWQARVQLAERIGARVITDIKTPAAFPTRHPLHVGEAGTFLSPAQQKAIAIADVILDLDWIDPAGALRQSRQSGEQLPQVISVGLGHSLANGWSYDHYAMLPATVSLPTTADIAVRHLLSALGDTPRQSTPSIAAQTGASISEAATQTLTLRTLAQSIGTAVRGRSVSFLRFPLGWPADETPFSEPLDYLGADGGAGVGSGPGLAVGGALALRVSGRLAIAVLGDGDFVMGASAVWTATHYRLPLLIVVANNRSYFNDEVHQESVARTRGRPAENRWIGQRLDDPAIDIHQLARSFGATTAKLPISNPKDLQAALDEALRAVENGATYILDVQIDVGYASAMPVTENKA
jgi:thiamine pyrophosphate-dependent acetolactate synthase large subunit-like protein